MASCNTSRDYLSRGDNDNTLFDAIKTLKKRNTDTTALSALPVLYNLAQQRNLRKINSYSNSNNLDRWDKMINVYGTLQEMHDAIIENDAASRVVTPVNYRQTIYELKQQAAADYYSIAAESLKKPGRDEAKKAYNYFKKADKLVTGYEDAKLRMDEAFESAIVNVVINPVQDNSFFFNSGWGNTGYNYSNEYFQQTLIRELGGKYASRYPAKFYTEWEARRDNVQPDWEVKVVKNGPPLNGVNALDLVRIQKHLLFIDPLDDPLSKLAADANKSGTINSLDVVTLLRIILGINTNFPDQQSWIVIPADTDFGPPTQHPPVIPSYTIPLQDILDGIRAPAFIGIKRGDANGSANPNQ